MTVILIRTILIYAILLLTMRFMGKRQVGELEISDLVITVLISEVATLPLTDTDIPLLHALIPVLTLLTFEVVFSMLTARFPRLKNLFTVRPATLIKKGTLCQKEMSDSRISADELIGELRQQGVTDIDQVEYAILEQNGKITVIQKARFQQPNAEQLGILTEESGLYHIMVDKGIANQHALKEMGWSTQQLEHTLADHHLRQKDVYLMMVGDRGDLRIIRKDGGR
ncbi:MAG: DUF421 domain-containing protein [Clostridia bacterium]|nr:DUF421 domain-containing protein [Clostridia bacterium]